MLVQVGLLDRTLPVRGGEIAAQVQNPTQPMNEFIRRESNQKPVIRRREGPPHADGGHDGAYPMFAYPAVPMDVLTRVKLGWVSGHNLDQGLT